MNTMDNASREIRPTLMPEEIRPIVIKWANDIFELISHTNRGELESKDRLKKYYKLNMREVSLYASLIYQLQYGDRSRASWCLYEIEKKLRNNHIPRQMLSYLKKALNYRYWKKQWSKHHL